MTTITIERAVIHRALSALEYHTQQTRPIHNTELVIEELKSALAAPATAPDERLRKDAERKPMTAAERKLAFLELEHESSYKDFTDGIDAAEAFHGIKGTP